MAGINPIPPNSPIPSNPPVFLSTILADELYKYDNPPPSYQAAIGSPNASQSRNQSRAIIMAAPFGGSLSQVFPCHSTQFTMEPPPAYSQSPPRRNSMEDTTLMDRLFICYARVDKDCCCLTIACISLLLATLCIFVLLNRLVLHNN